MGDRGISRLRDVAGLSVNRDRLASATHEEILKGETTDIYFVKTRDVLAAGGMLDTPVVAEIFTRKPGIFAGLSEMLRLLEGQDLEIYSLQEGDAFDSREVLVRVHGSYGSFGMLETVYLGMLASSTAWATAARECVDAAEGKPVLCFGARHVHPAVAPVMEKVAVTVGGCKAASCILGAKLAGMEPSGTVPHAAILIAGDTVKLAKLYDGTLSSEEPRLVLVDTFKDETEEALRVAKALEGRLSGVRLDTPGERGGVTPELVKELRWRLDKAGFPDVSIVASGGLNPDRIRVLSKAGVDSFGVGSYISNPSPMDMTMDIKEVDGVPIAKRGRLPGIMNSPRLKRVL
ncbi:nicotinate phosphoribosyltransferase [Dethiosulfovibrio sp. F2B]|uniref:nicotinate phosphoribosyltransferase n=1 Tax=Dethiosulfovibrio faecalis TaxID=2720018 RepID=UPI001F3471E8|nr:nicotinate phosphoribosyltransferase [Dethiosulfovibrio faecalis]MCF4152681.1 nicotinate phosphoribosyltransferase [Dethiosulfovibrio faecalis]